MAAISAVPVPASAPKSDSVFKPALLLMTGRTVAFGATFLIPLILARVFDPAQCAQSLATTRIWE